MFTQRSYIHHQLKRRKELLEAYLSAGWDRFPNKYGKYDDISTSNRILDLELEIRYLQQVADAWDLIEELNINDPFIRNTIKIPVRTIIHKYYPGTQYLELDDIQTAAAVAILVNGKNI